MNTEEIKYMCAFAESLKHNLEIRGCTDVQVDIIPDDMIIKTSWTCVKPVNFIKVNLELENE